MQPAYLPALLRGGPAPACWLRVCVCAGTAQAARATSLEPGLEAEGEGRREGMQEGEGEGRSRNVRDREREEGRAAGGAHRQRGGWQSDSQGSPRFLPWCTCSTNPLPLSMGSTVSGSDAAPVTGAGVISQGQRNTKIITVSRQLT